MHLWTFPTDAVTPNSLSLDANSCTTISFNIVDDGKLSLQQLRDGKNSDEYDLID